MGLAEVRSEIKRHIKKAGEKQIIHIQKLIETGKGWAGDKAPKNAESTMNGPDKFHNKWMWATGALKGRRGSQGSGLRTTIYKNPQGFVMYVKGKKKQHPNYRGKSNPAPSYQELLSWWNTGNAGFSHKGSGYYSGAVPPQLTPDIDKELTDNIMNTIADEFKEIKKKISRFL